MQPFFQKNRESSSSQVETSKAPELDNEDSPQAPSPFCDKIEYFVSII